MLRGVVFDPRFDQLHGLHDGLVRDSPRLSQLPYDSAQEDDAGAEDAAEKRRLLKQNGPPLNALNVLGSMPMCRAARELLP